MAANDVTEPYPYCMDAAFMSFQLRESGIHAV
jgi:hypothetical protein